MTGFHCVLLVDRNIDELRRVRELLQSNGNFHVAAARDGMEAAALIRQGAFDAVVVDEDMWAEHGVDVLRSISCDAPGLAVLLVTSERGRTCPAPRGAHPDATFFRAHLGDGRDLAERAVSLVQSSRSARCRATVLRWLERDARTDRLTGLHNRVAFLESLEASCERALASDAPVGLVLMRVTGLTSVRESHGPAECDALLQRAAVALGRSVRGIDFSARSGSHEFAVIVEGADLELLRLISRRIAHQVERLNQTDWVDEIPVEVEFGIASATAPETSTLYDTAHSQLTPDAERRPRPLGLQGLFDEDGPSVA